MDSIVHNSRGCQPHVGDAIKDMGGSEREGVRGYSKSVAPVEAGAHPGAASLRCRRWRWRRLHCRQSISDYQDPALLLGSGNGPLHHNIFNMC